MRLSDFNYNLPPELIAQHPLPDRTASRLLELGVDAAGQTFIQDKQFTDVINLIQANDLLVFNDTKVIPARLFGKKESGGAVEVLLERVTGIDTAITQIRASKSPKPGATLLMGDSEDPFTIEVIGRHDGTQSPFFEVRFSGPCIPLLEKHGHLPLPPYITHTPGSDDETRYQTVYARNPGAVAAPTAGLHFDDAILAQLKTKGIETATVTLHVGAGTFQPVRAENLDEHVMHHEWYHLPEATVKAIDTCRARGGKVVAVGTTSLRALESAARHQNIEPGGSLHADSRETDLFIRPGYQFKVVDRLITNFHLPKSTLLMLVSAFAGYDTMRAAYQHAIEQQYRFFSYGDAMLLTRTEHAS